MAKVTFTFEDSDAGVEFHADFDPKIEDLEEDEEGYVILTPAQNIADQVFSLIVGTKSLPGSCVGGCGDCACG
jgi:hypothetical protein